MGKGKWVRLAKLTAEQAETLKPQIAAVLSCGIQYAMGSAEQFTDFAIQFPWQSLGISAAGVFALVAVTMLYAVGKLKKENLLDALRDDGV